MAMFRERRMLATTEMLPAARKKSVVSEFPMKSVDHSWLGGCARKRWNWNNLYQDGNGAGEMMRACRSDDNSGGGENKGRRKTTMTVPQVIKDDQEAQRSHGGVFPTPARSQGRHACAWNAEDSRRPCSKSDEHCSLILQNCHPV